MQRKRVVGFVKSEVEGRVTARFARLGGDVPDMDGDIVAHGSIGEQDILMSAYGHTSWGGALPVGRGRVFERGNEAIADLQLFTDTTHGRDTYNTIVGLGSLGEWSMGYRVLEEKAPTEEQREIGIVRILKKLKVHEVSPVLQAAGVDTQTLAVKCDGCAAKAAARRCRPPTHMLQTARASLAAAEKVLNGSDPGNGRGLAEFAAYLGHILNGCPGRIKEPAVKFFAPGEISCTDGYITPGVPVTHIASDLAGEALVRTVLHESAHHGQADPRTAAAEWEACEFARLWARAVHRAYRRSNGQAHRISVSSARQPPFPGGHVYGDVVLCRGRAWVLSSQTVNPWTT